MKNSRTAPLMVALALALLALAPAGALGQDEDGEFSWPKKLTVARGEIIIYQPQIESLVGDKLESRSAISIKAAGQEDMIFGAMWFQSQLATDMDTRRATLIQTKVTAAKFPDADQEEVDELSRYLEQEIPKWDISLSLDRLLASLPDHEGEDENFGNDHPQIHYRTVPTVLVTIDGDPILTELNGFDLEYVANSAFFIVKDKKSGFYLRGSGMWFVSDDIGGPWKRTEDLPPEVSQTTAAPKREDLDGLFELPAEGLVLETLEEHLVCQALRRTRGNRARAARLLGMNRDQMRYRIKKFGWARTRDE